MREDKAAVSSFQQGAEVWPAKVQVECHAWQPKGCDRWIGECKFLGVVLEADDLNDLYAAFGDAFRLLLIDLIEDGELEEFLIDRGWKETSEFVRAAEVAIPWQLTALGGTTSGIEPRARKRVEA